MSIRIKRIYEPPAKEDGLRVLVDRLWPRGMSKARARVDQWLKQISPSDSLRRKFHHDPKKWKEFRAQYFKELDRARRGDAAQTRSSTRDGHAFVCGT